MANGKVIDTFSDYMNDETRVTPAERERINFEVALIGKMIKANCSHLLLEGNDYE